MSLRAFVCLFPLCLLKRLTFDLDFLRLYGSARIGLKFEVTDQGQMSRSRCVLLEYILRRAPSVGCSDAPRYACAYPGETDRNDRQ